MKPRIAPSSVLAQTRNTSAIGALLIQRLRARQAVAAGDLLRPRDHRAGVGAVVGLGEAEAADPLAAARASADTSPSGPGVPNCSIGSITSEDCTDIIER